MKIDNSNLRYFLNRIPILYKLNSHSKTLNDRKIQHKFFGTYFYFGVLKRLNVNVNINKIYF